MYLDPNAYEANALSFELDATYDARKSFYGKAHVHPRHDGLILVSYDTPVAFAGRDGSFYVAPAADYSATTRRHVKEFAKQTGHHEVDLKFIRDDSHVVRIDYGSNWGRTPTACKA